MIEEVCDIVGHHHHPRDKETLNYKVLYDADLIVNLEENQKDSKGDRPAAPAKPEKMEGIIEKSFLTERGRKSGSGDFIDDLRATGRCPNKLTIPEITQRNKMKIFRKIIEIDPDRCDGCGQCVPSCAEGAIQVIDGKARLAAEKYCDGLGAVL